MTMPAVGQKAPAFRGKDQDGKTWSLKDFKGKKLVLYFYPQDSTPTCTVQACNLRDHYTMLMDAGFAVLGVSPDDAESHRKFIGKQKLPFPLLTDPQHKIVEAYGVWGEKQMFGHKYMGLLRTTFVINDKGIIEQVIRRPKVKLHAQEILGAI